MSLASPSAIYAVATGAGRAAIAVIRVSGAGARPAIEALAGRLPAPRQARLTEFRDPASSELLDRGVLLWFPAPRSATGEDYAELHVHGGPAVVKAMLAALGRLPGLRPAEPGEFARRAFASGKMDLSQVEALADLIDAGTEFQRRQALRALGGALRTKIESWRSTIVQALAMVEAELDFSDEADVGAKASAGLEALLSPMHADMRATLRRAPASERMREGFTVLILGPPNSGKSTLLNALARRDAAIVSDIPGTTRDMIEAHLDLAGMPVTFVDSAGLREAADEIERIGVNRTLERAHEADLLLWLSEAGRAAPPPGLGGGAETLLVATKADALTPAPGQLAISAQTGLGLERLFAEILARAKTSLGDGSASLLTRERHRALIQRAARAIEMALEPGKALELSADDLREAGRAFGQIVGAVDVEHVLDAIFSRFCTGK